MIEGVSARLTFGPFSFEPASGTLRRQGIAVPLQPQPAKVLTILIERGGEVVSRDQLRQLIWPEGTYVDFERGLNFSIARIRAALNDSADSPHYIETLPKRGYRFIGPVTRDTQDDQSLSAPPAPSVAAEAPKQTPAPEPAPRRSWVRAGAVAGVIALLGVVAAVRYSRGPGLPVVAVVSFDNETGQDTYDDVAVAIADQTVVRLATPGRMKKLRVIGNAAALRKPRAFRDIKTIGEAVKAKYVVLAQMKIDSQKVRVIAHLIRISDETHVWADSFDRQGFSLDAQMDIAETIARAVEARIDAGDQ
jgi:DNA-binding winged helix-turn-helix (wHTH) protein/TolB-like protein